MTKELIVSGRVQGVGFRYYTLTQASMYGLSGYVKNLYNGDVKIVVQGEQALISEFKIRITEGPRMSIVENIRETEINHSKDYDSFEIR